MRRNDHTILLHRFTPHLKYDKSLAGLTALTPKEKKNQDLFALSHHSTLPIRHVHKQELWNLMVHYRPLVVFFIVFATIKTYHSRTLFPFFVFVILFQPPRVWAFSYKKKSVAIDSSFPSPLIALPDLQKPLPSFFYYCFRQRAHLPGK